MQIEIVDNLIFILMLALIVILLVIAASTIALKLTRKSFRLIPSGRTRSEGIFYKMGFGFIFIVVFLLSYLIASIGVKIPSTDLIFDMALWESGILYIVLGGVVASIFIIRIFTMFHKRGTPLAINMSNPFVGYEKRKKKRWGKRR